MENLFSSGALGHRTTRNRIVSQAMEGNDGVDGGRVSDRTRRRYLSLARGGWGVVVVEALSITRESLARRNALVIDEDTLPGLTALVNDMREIDPRLVILFQITHSGKQSGDFSRRTTVWTDAEHHDLLTEAEIERIRLGFVNAARLAAKAGADGVDFKMCHGYFGSEILRPSNQRIDRWGGSLENRTRFLKESVEEIRADLPAKNFILGSRISMYEGIRGGCGTAGPDELIEDLSEMRSIIRLMDGLGMDYVNVSAGIPGVTSEITRPTRASKHLYLQHLRYAAETKALGLELKVIGSGYSTLEAEAPVIADENLAKGTVDFAGFGRMSFADPLLPAKLIHGGDVNWCTTCSGCTRLMVRQEPTSCIVYNKEAVAHG